MTQQEINYINETAKTIYSQLRATAGWNVLGSWGLHKIAADYINGMPALTFLVQGYDYKGRIWVAYNEGADTYKILGRKQGQRVPQVLIEETFCDTFAETLDTIIETGHNGRERYKAS